MSLYHIFNLGSIAFIGCLTISIISCVHLPGEQPNILWITCEDISPHLGCYGDQYAYTPNLDKMAKDGVLFQNAFTTAPVCTPARSSIITGKYACTLGTQHLRGPAILSERVKCFTEYMRESGYYCMNFNKTDYNFQVPHKAWDRNSGADHRSLVPEYISKIPFGQSFFCVFNINITHQSRTRYGLDELTKRNDVLPVEARHDPELAPVPPYYPNTAEVKTNIAALCTQITLMDQYVGDILKDLDEFGLAENTIVFFYSDHGDGLPRHKRWLYHMGTRVPFIVRFPEKYTHLSPVQIGSEATSIINFVDLAPTMLAITGCELPSDLPGKVFMGKNREERKYTFGIRDRVDEVYEFSRSVSDGNFQYIRNFANDKPFMQWSNYSEITPIRKELRKLHALGKLNDKTGWLMQDFKPVEELYDMESDPFQMNNLADDPKYGEKLKDMKSTLFSWMINNRDLSLVPEPLMRSRAKDKSPMDPWADNGLFPIEETLTLADLKGRGSQHREALSEKLSNPSPVLRYWAAKGLSELKSLPGETKIALNSCLNDKYQIVRLAAADALCKSGPGLALPIKALGEALQSDDIMLRIYAAMSLMDLKEKAAPVREDVVKSLENPSYRIPSKYFETYLDDALKKILENIE